MELERIKNGDFPMPPHEIKPFELTYETRKIISEFANWLYRNEIALETCNQWESAELMKMFKREELNIKKTKKQRETLLEIVIKSKLILEKYSKDRKIQNFFIQATKNFYIKVMWSDTKYITFLLLKIKK